VIKYVLKGNALIDRVVEILNSRSRKIYHYNKDDHYLYCQGKPVAYFEKDVSTGLRRIYIHDNTEKVLKAIKKALLEVLLVVGDVLDVDVHFDLPQRKKAKSKPHDRLILFQKFYNQRSKKFKRKKSGGKNV
jgi:hypothetical protein